MSNQRKGLENETKFLKNLFDLGIQPKKLHLEMMSNLQKQSENIDGIDTDKGPIPKEIVAEVKKLQEKLENSREEFEGSSNRTQMGTRVQPDIQSIRENSHRQQLGICTDSTSEYILESADFIELVREGTADARDTYQRGQPMPPKTAYSETGELYLPGPAWSRNVFGFKTTVNLPNPGKEYTVDIYSKVRMVFSHLESQNWGMFTYGELTALSYLDAVTSDASYRDGGYQLHHSVTPGSGLPPRRIYLNVESGTKNMHISMQVKNPPNSNSLVHIFEMAEFIAERHGNPQWCNAEIFGTCTWSPLVVTTIEHC